MELCGKVGDGPGKGGRHLDERTFIVSDKRSITEMQDALAALLGKDAPNLSPAVLARLKAGRQEEYER